MKNKLTNYIIVYDANGKFIGFYDDPDVVKTILSQSENYQYSFITDELHNYILELPFTPNDSLIDVTKINQPETIIDNKTFIKTIAPIPVNIRQIRDNLLQNIKAACKSHIINGVAVTLANGLIKEFSFEIEDQINLQNIIAHYQSGDKITYHAKNETFAIYDYDDLCTIYRELYNNKLYNLIYTQVLCDYIMNYYTEEQYLNKEVITYGYSNDKILEEVNRQYASQLLQC